MAFFRELRRRRLHWALTLVAGASTGAGVSYALAASVECQAECPAGTQLVNFTANTFEVSADGSFLWVEESCEATCAPIAPCYWPNLPVVTKEAGFTCQAQTGFSTLPGDNDVDLSFGATFDPALAGPPSDDPGALDGRLIIRGTGFGASEGLTVALGLYTGNFETQAGRIATITDGAFEFDYTGMIASGPYGVFFFVDSNGDQSCMDDGVSLVSGGTMAPETGLPEIFVIDANDSFGAGGQNLCDYLEGLL